MKKPKPKKKSKKQVKPKKKPTWRDRALKRMPGEIALINDD